MALHDVRFPGESQEYRTARDALLVAEKALLDRQEEVAAMRRKLPLGGKINEDYVIRSLEGDVKMSELFTKGTTLVVYNFMYGPKMKSPCPMCTSMLDALEGNAHHIAQRTDLVVVARSPIERIQEHAKARNWTRFRLLSSANNTYNRDYRGEDEKEAQWPALNVFVKRGADIHHFWGAELLFVKNEDGRDSRHVDMLWPLWHLLDTTPEGRGDFYPKLSY
jgi:predicted dithiol-disulfide oxidoreductase (DUF899 family)